MIRDAVISACGRYRYLLTRSWDLELGQSPRRILWVMLNPSTADGLKDDPTIRKCIGFTKQMGANAFDVVNLFAFRATSPLRLGALSKEEAIGPENDHYIQTAAAGADRVIVAWGGRGILHGRVEEVRMLLTVLPRSLTALRLGKEGYPWHPLYAPYNSTLVPWPKVEVEEEARR